MSTLLWLVFGLWVPHYEMLMQEFQGMGKFQHKRIFSLFKITSFLCARQCHNKRLLESHSKMKSVVLNISVFAGLIYFFIRDMKVIFD